MGGGVLSGHCSLRDHCCRLKETAPLWNSYEDLGSLGWLEWLASKSKLKDIKKEEEDSVDDANGHYDYDHDQLYNQNNILYDQNNDNLNDHNKDESYDFEDDDRTTEDVIYQSAKDDLDSFLNNYPDNLFETIANYEDWETPTPISNTVEYETNYDKDHENLDEPTIDYIYPVINEEDDTPFLLSDFNTRDILYHDIVETNSTQATTEAETSTNTTTTATEVYTVETTATSVESYQAVVDQNNKLVDILQSTLEMQAYLLDKIVAFFIK